MKKNFKNKKEFKKECDSIENKSEFSKDIKLRKIVRAMMNAKPDLAVIYYDKGARKLLFIECKYESDEDNYIFYYYSENEEVIRGTISQTAVQGYIADFLCQCRGYMNGVQVSELMDNKKPKGYEGEYLSKMVKFVASQDASKCENSNKRSNESKDNPNNTEEYPINIKDLIEIEEGIFNK